MNHVVIGAGQVGRAVAAVLGDAVLRDIGDPVVPADVLHICFPYGDDFLAQAHEYVTAYAPSLVIVHSTVAVGTCSQLGAVHSPVTGKHPDLALGILTFVKFFGGPDAETAAAIFEARGVRTECYPDAETTEAGKLWATLQYGWLIALEKECRRFAENHGADPDIAYRRFNEVYNEGYEALGLPHRLPILDDVPGPIGGHCVIANARLTPAYLARQLVRLNGAW